MKPIIRTRLIKIGNSQGIRIPKVVLDQLNLIDAIELEVQDNLLIVRPSQAARTNWSGQFQQMATLGDDTLLDPALNSSQWEETEWEL